MPTSRRQRKHITPKAYLQPLSLFFTKVQYVHMTDHLVINLHALLHHALLFLAVMHHNLVDKFLCHVGGKR